MGTKMHHHTGRLSLVLRGSLLTLPPRRVRNFIHNPIQEGADFGRNQTCGRVDDIDPFGRGHRIIGKNCGQPAALQFRPCQPVGPCGSQSARNRHDAWAGPDWCRWIAIPIVARYIPRGDRYGGIFVKREANPNFLNGVPELLVLQLLKGREMYGYELVQAIKEATGETIVLGEGVVLSGPAHAGTRRSASIEAPVGIWPEPHLLQPDPQGGEPPDQRFRVMAAHRASHPQCAGGAAPCVNRLHRCGSAFCEPASGRERPTGMSRN